jgi:hypothetical protein
VHKHMQTSTLLRGYAVAPCCDARAHACSLGLCTFVYVKLGAEHAPPLSVSLDRPRSPPVEHTTRTGPGAGNIHIAPPLHPSLSIWASGTMEGPASIALICADSWLLEATAIRTVVTRALAALWPEEIIEQWNRTRVRLVREAVV